MDAEQALSEAERYIALRDPGAAEAQIAAKWSDIDRAPADAKHVLGIVRAMQGRHAESEHLMRAAVAEDPKSLRHAIALGHCLIQAGKPSEAADAYAVALKLDPRWDGLLKDYANALYGAGRYAEAEQAARQLIKEAPSPQAWDVLSCALRRQGKAADALQAANEALRTAPEFLGALHSRGAALLQLGQAQDALLIFEEVVARGGQGPALSYSHAKALEALGRKTEADAMRAETRRRWPAAPPD